jgi:parvulin-like peptidyl-prolyl isomerase
MSAWLVSVGLVTVGFAGAAVVGGCGRPLSDYERPETPAKAADLTAGGDWASPKPFDSVTVRAIFVSWKGAAGAPDAVTRSQEQALLRAKTLSDMMRDGDGNFAGLVREYSDDRISFGERRTIKKGEGTYPAAAEDVALHLYIGQTSRPIKTERGFFVMERVADPGTEVVTVDRIRTKHILIQYKGSRGAGEGIVRTKEEAKALAEKLRAELLASPETWDAVATKHTDEPGSHDGGDTGYFGRGAMVAPFEAAAFALAVGSISNVTETPFGFHVILRTE